MFNSEREIVQESAYFCCFRFYNGHGRVKGVFVGSGVAICRPPSGGGCYATELCIDSTKPMKHESFLSIIRKGSRILTAIDLSEVSYNQSNFSRSPITWYEEFGSLGLPKSAALLS